MSKHDECGAVGKFDCEHDEAIYEITLESGTSEGHVESPVGWFEPIELDSDEDATLTEHYGTLFLIARENNLGQFWVECYDTEQFRDERLEGLRTAYAEWDEGVL